MIFVTVGSLFPFDRLIRAVDEFAPAWQEQKFFAQIGNGTYEPKHMPFSRILSVSAYGQIVQSARLIIAHAGMGSVIAAMEAKLPIVILPRRHELGEHTTDHQMATARRLIGAKGLFVVMGEDDLQAAVGEALSTAFAGDQLSEAAPPAFLDKIRNFVSES